MSSCSCLAGGAAITFGWAGTARVTCVDCQVPYLISGGAGGVALTVLGTGLPVIAQLRFEATGSPRCSRPGPQTREGEPEVADSTTHTARLPAVADKDLADQDTTVRGSRTPV